MLHSFTSFFHALYICLFYSFLTSPLFFLFFRNPGHVPPYMVEASMRLSEVINMERSRIHHANSGANQIHTSAYDHMQHNMHPHSNANLISNNSNLNRSAHVERTNTSTNINRNGNNINNIINGNDIHGHFNRVEIPSTAVLERHIHLAANLAARRLYGEHAVNMRHHVNQHANLGQTLNQIPHQIPNQIPQTLTHQNLNQNQNQILESVRDPSVNRVSSGLQIPQGTEVAPLYHLPIHLPVRTLHHQPQGDIYDLNLLRANENFQRGQNSAPQLPRNISIDTNGHINTNNASNPIYSRVNSNLNSTVNTTTNSIDSPTIFCERIYQ